MTTPNEMSDSRVADLFGAPSANGASSLWASVDLDDSQSIMASLSTLHPDALTAPPEPRVVPAAGAEGAPAEYEVIRRIGAGGMGVVFEARQVSLGRSVALKMIRPALMDDALARRRFFAEAALTGELEHPGIITVFDSGITDKDRAFYAMRLVRGRPWNESIRSRSLAENIDILECVAEAVAFAHERRILHRDLKPANIFVDAQSVAWIGDWGLAARLDENGFLPPASANHLVGTPTYMPPEAAQGSARVGVTADVYLLGAMLYEILTGRPPHSATHVRDCLDVAAHNTVDYSAMTALMAAHEAIDEDASAPTPSPPVASAAATAIFPPEETEWRIWLFKLARKALATDPVKRVPTAALFAKGLRAAAAHRDAAHYTAQGRQRLVLAQAKADFDDCAEAATLFENALHALPGHPPAETGLRETRTAQARLAYARGEFDLTASLVKPWAATDRDAAQLTADASRAHRRRRTLRIAAVFGGGTLAVALAVIGWTAWNARHAAMDGGAAAIQSFADSEEEVKRITMKYSMMTHELPALNENPLDGFESELPGLITSPAYDNKRTEAIEAIRRAASANPDVNAIELAMFDTFPGQFSKPYFESFKSKNPILFERLDKLLAAWESDWEKDLDHAAPMFSRRLAEHDKRRAARIARDAGELYRIAEEAEAAAPDDPLIGLFAMRLRRFTDSYAKP